MSDKKPRLVFLQPENALYLISNQNFHRMNKVCSNVYFIWHFMLLSKNTSLIVYVMRINLPSNSLFPGFLLLLNSRCFASKVIPPFPGCAASHAQLGWWRIRTLLAAANMYNPAVMNCTRLKRSFLTGREQQQLQLQLQLGLMYLLTRSNSTC